jgi:hypothetical protein
MGEARGRSGGRHTQGFVERQEPFVHAGLLEQVGRFVCKSVLDR